MNPLTALLAVDPDRVILTERDGELFISFVDSHITGSSLN